jgi:hypothetical protein
MPQAKVGEVELCYESMGDGKPLRASAESRARRSRIGFGGSGRDRDDVAALGVLLGRVVEREVDWRMDPSRGRRDHAQPDRYPGGSQICTD